MANSELWHTELGMLDIRKSDLGRPDLPLLWERLLADKRPVPDRQLQCGEICRAHGYVEWMHVYERQGRRIAAHQSKAAERRHEANESDEHKAYKERTIRVAEAEGHRAEAEVRTEDGKVRSDVLIYGATEMPTAFEIQRSRESEQTIRRRTKAALDHGILAAWHTDRRDLFNRNEVAWTRTDILPPEVIKTDKHLAVRGGVRRLDMERCDERSARPCPVKSTGKCGGWHPHSRPIQVPYDDLVRSIAAGQYVQIAVKERRETFRFWVPAADRDRYEDVLGRPATRTDTSARKRPATASSDDPTCRSRPHVEVTRPALALNWRDASHFSRSPAPCRICGSPASLLDDSGRPAHKVCVEDEQQAT